MPPCPRPPFIADDATRRGAAGSAQLLDNLGGPVNVANDLLQSPVHQCRQGGRRASWSTPPSAWREFSMSPPAGACPPATATSARRWAPMACRKGLIWCCPLRGPTAVRDFSGNYVDGFFSPLYYCMCDYTGQQYVGLVKSTLGSVDNRSANIVTYRGYRAGLGGLSTPPCGTCTGSAASGWSRTRRLPPRNCPTSSFPPDPAFKQSGRKML